MKSVYSFFFFFLFSFFSHSICSQGAVSRITFIPKVLKAEVVGIQDGDTIELKVVYDGKGARNRQGKNLRIRLLHVDCPERGFPLWKQAKQTTSDLCFRKVVKVMNTGSFDRYGRLLGEVHLPDGKVLNKELVKTGMAVHFKKYSGDREYAALEVKARQQKLGVWKL
ncbi:nuclease [Emticicia sp. CRIBPO]|uniref:thermonuclease family protein n=1 Tax=Emticicia sp. CRIBPO TaxID=2683258 RepID=UPI0014132998|nr:thermonuclease family protein [Emticicia sp. CRIBPO]NBA86557.1 nuclease [Emticicia sp. CRIBPO]